MTRPAPRVLIVDDEPANRRLLTDLVAREGYVPLLAGGGEEALALLYRESVDLVLLDLMMPEVDGMAVLEELQRHGLVPGLPVVVVTAHEEREVRVNALGAGAIDFIAKPFDRVEMACRIRTLLELKRLREAAEEAASGARSLLQAVLDHAPDQILSVDRAGVIDFANRSDPGSSGTARVGTSFLAQLPEDQREAARAVLEQVLATGRTAGYEVKATGHDGEPAWLASHVGPVRRGEEIVGAVILTRDVTEKRRTEAQLRMSERMASVGALAAGVAHEINNPLAALIGNLELVAADLPALLVDLDELARAGDGQPPDARLVRLPARVRDLEEPLRDATEAAWRLKLIARDLRIFSHSDEEQRTAVELRRVLESCLRMAKNEILPRARLVTDFGDVPPVWGSESRLGQVFLNLLINAAQAIPEGHASDNEVRVVTRMWSDTQVSIDVCDTGTGIPRAVLSRIFDPFFTTKPAGAGSGLGLAICRRIVAEMGGDIEVESVEGRGARFRTLLPVAADEAPVASTPRPLPAREGTRSRSTTSRRLA